MKLSKQALLFGTICIAAIATATVFTPQSMNVVRGRVVSGNIGSLFNSDDNRLVVAGGVRLTPYDSPVDIQSDVVCGQPNPVTMTLHIESSASTSGLIEYVEMFNWSTNRYEEVHRGPIARTESLLLVPVTNPGRYTGSIGQMKVRYWVDSRSPVTTFPWTISLDELTWDVTF